MKFPGTWVTLSKSLVYRVVPKCACSTIGQIMYYSDNGEFFDGDIHDAGDGILKWNQEESRNDIINSVTDPNALVFTCVRNPYRRILSSFFDKICSIQRNGTYYRGNLVPKLIDTYGIKVDGDFDQIASFRRFLLFARDTIIHRKPMDPDIHWSAMSGHISTLILNGGEFDNIFHMESFNENMQSILNKIDSKHFVDVDKMPRFNESQGNGLKRKYPVADYFDDLSMHLIYEIYHRDFSLFNYDWTDPGRAEPLGEVDVDRANKLLSG